MTCSNNSNKNIWFPFTYHSDLNTYPPIVIERGAGLYLYDACGKEYIDGIGSWWVSILGHCHPEISAAIHQQLDKLEHVIMAGFVTPPALRLGELLQKVLPRGLTRIFYSDDGSTAVEAALKIALQYHVLKGDAKRKRFVALGFGYHGDTLGAMSVGSIPAYHTLFHEQFSRQLYTDQPNCFRCPCNRQKETCSAECMDSLETILAREGGTVAAFIFEPMVQGAAGMRIYPAKVLKKAFEICARHKILTIADEIAMGFGRTGTFFACEHAGVVPDIMCVAKGLTGGYLPLSVTAVREYIYEEFQGDFQSDRIFCHGHSFTGNPLCAAAACATLEIFIRDNLPAGVHATMAYFREQLEQFREIALIGEVRSIGMIGALEFVANRKTKERLPAHKRTTFSIARRAIEKGLLIRPLGDIIYFIPSLLITRGQIDTMFALARESIEEIIHEQYDTV